MKLAELLALARASVQSEPNPASVTDRLARGVLELLGAGSLCGREPFQVAGGRILIGDTNGLEVGDELTPDEARSWAADLLRAAGEAEG